MGGGGFSVLMCACRGRVGACQCTGVCGGGGGSRAWSVYRVSGQCTGVGVGGVGGWGGRRVVSVPVCVWGCGGGGSGAWSVYIYVRMCVCTCSRQGQEREGERGKRKRGRKKGKGGEGIRNTIFLPLLMCMSGPSEPAKH